MSSSTGIPATHPNNVIGIDFVNPLISYDDYKTLGDNHNLFVGLTHIGHSSDIALAEKAPELDIIIGGHSHTVISNPSLTNGVLIAQAGSNGNYLGKIKVVLEK